MNVLLLLPAFISFSEISVILLVSVIIFGPKRIPEIARGLGEGIRAMKKATDDIKQEIMNPVETVKEEINKPFSDFNPNQIIQKEIDTTKNSLMEDIPNPIKEIEESIDDIVGPVKRK